ncbi:MAG: hypothetical protein ACI4E1_04735 [Lachnospira sp.]
MKKIFKLELYRATHSISFIITLIIGAGIAIGDFVTNAYPVSTNILKWYKGVCTYPENVYFRWLGGGMTGFFTLYTTILPILIVLPFGISLYLDIKSGYIKNLMLRTSLKNYYKAKYIVNFIVGGIVAVFPLVLSFCMTAAVLPALNPIGNCVGIGKSLYGIIYYKYPLLTIFLLFVLVYLLGGIYAVLPLAFSTFVRNILLLSLIPFIIWYILSLASRYLPVRISPSSAIRIYNGNVSLICILLELIIVAVSSYMMLMTHSRKGDIIS